MKYLLILLVLFLWTAGMICAQPKIVNLRTEYLTNPVGLDSPSPRFTWMIRSDRKGCLQASYSLQIASSPELLEKGKADIWDSGVVRCGESRAVYHAAKALQSHTVYYWRVQVRDRSGRNGCSPIATFETAKMNAKDWDAAWITDHFTKEFRKSPMLRKNFNLTKEIRRARAYVCGLGYYVLYLNGKRVGDRWLDPGYTDFRRRVLYSTYDVTSLVKKGGNAVAGVLGNGWFNIQALAVWGFQNAEWRMRPRLLCEIRVEYTDGSQEIIATNSSWKTNTGPYLYNNLYSGDFYDARLEKTGWTEAGYKDDEWTDAIIADATAPKLAAQQMPPTRVTEEVKPVDMRVFADNVYVFRMEKNMAGVCRLRLSGEAGTRVTVSYGELLSPDGRLNQGNIALYFQREKNGMPFHLDPAEEFQTDVFYLKGEGTEEFVPSFTYHGFQYVEVRSSKPIHIDKESLTGLFLHTDVEPAGSFTCSNEILNKLAEASRRSYLSNLYSIPTDCPQREKNGWTADGYISMDLGLLNYDGITVYEKWVNDFVDNQREEGNISGIVPSSGWGYTDWIGPVWDAGMFIVPYNLYLYYGDNRAIETIYPSCEKYLQYLEKKETDGKLTYGIGDWVFYKTRTPTDFTSTAFYYLDNKLMALFAKLLGKDGSVYEQKAAKLRDLVNKNWLDVHKGVYAGGTQAAQAVALALGLVDKDREQQVAGNLAAMIRENGYQLDFGMLGSKFVPAMLSRYGFAEEAYRMITSEKAPSWASWIRKGLTTLPETWVLDDKYKDASLNHVFLGDVTAWMTKTIAGINYDENQPGYAHIVIRPHFIHDLLWAKGEYRSVRGLIRSEWRRESGKIVLSVLIPPNCTATLHTEKEISLGSGSYKFTINDK